MGLKADETYVDSLSASVAATAHSELATHTGRTDNPHGVTRAQVGLGNVDNTPAKANIGGPASATVVRYGMSATALAGSINEVAGFIPINGVPAEVPLSPARVAPRPSFGYYISGVGGGLFTETPPSVGTRYFWYEEPVN